jgi:hypothetical protein
VWRAVLLRIKNSFETNALAYLSSAEAKKRKMFYNFVARWP